MKTDNFSNLKDMTLIRQKLLRLQEQFENGLILEKDLSEEEIKALEKLYDEQILKIDNEILKKESVLYKKISLNNEYYRKAIALKIKK